MRIIQIIFLFIICNRTIAVEKSSPDISHDNIQYIDPQNICKSLGLPKVIDQSLLDDLGKLADNVSNPNLNQENLKILINYLSDVKKSMGNLDNVYKQISFLMYFFKGFTMLGEFNVEGRQLEKIMKYLSVKFNIDLGDHLPSILSKIKKIKIKKSKHGKSSIQISTKGRSIKENLKVKIDENKIDRDDEDSLTYIDSLNISNNTILTFDNSGSKQKLRKIKMLLDRKDDSSDNHAANRIFKKNLTKKSLQKVPPLHIAFKNEKSLQIKINTVDRDNVSLKIQEMYIVPQKLNNKSQSTVVMKMKPCAHVRFIGEMCKSSMVRLF